MQNVGQMVGQTHPCVQERILSHKINEQTVYSPLVYVSQSALGVVTQKQCHEWS